MDNPLTTVSTVVGFKLPFQLARMRECLWLLKEIWVWYQFFYGLTFI